MSYYYTSVAKADNQYEINHTILHAGDTFIVSCQYDL